MRNVRYDDKLAFDLICFSESNLAFLSISLDLVEARVFYYFQLKTSNNTIEAKKYQLFDENIVVDEPWFPHEPSTRLIKQ